MPSDRRLRSPRRDLCPGASPAPSLPVARPRSARRPTTPPCAPIRPPGDPATPPPLPRQLCLRSHPPHSLPVPPTPRPPRPLLVPRPTATAPTLPRPAAPRPACDPAARSHPLASRPRDLSPCPGSSVCAPFPRASEAPPSVDEAPSLLRGVARGDGCRVNRSFSGRGSGCRATIVCAILPLILTLVVRPRQCCSWTGGHPSGDRKAANLQVTSRTPRAYAAVDDATGGARAIRRQTLSAAQSTLRRSSAGGPRMPRPASVFHVKHRPPRRLTRGRAALLRGWPSPVPRSPRRPRPLAAEALPARRECSPRLRRGGCST